MGLYTFFIVMLFLIFLTLMLKNWKIRPLILLFAGIFNIIYVFYIFSNDVSSPLSGYLMFDSLGKIIYLGYSLLFLSLSVYAFDYLKLKPDRGNKIFIISMIANIITIQTACMSQDLGILWVSTEAATLSIAPLIYFNRTKYAIEATWKFILLTSIGIAIALLGIYMIGYAAFQISGHGTLNILELKQMSNLMDSKWLLFSSIFLILGFSSKMGLAPFHWWKPDAYGEAPGLIGALLSGGLVSVAALCLLRIYQMLSPSDMIIYYNNILLALGIISLFFSAVFITHQNDLKRMLAYSSLEHVGIIAIGLGIGRAGAFAAILHIFFNTLAKGVLFLSAGDIQRIFKSKKTEDISGLITVSPIIAIIFLSGVLAGAGSPPFSLFVSEFLILLSTVKMGNLFLAVLFIIFLVFIFMGIITMTIKVVYGQKSSQAGSLDDFRPTPFMISSEIFLILLVLIFTFYIPHNILDTLKDATLLLGVKI